MEGKENIVLYDWLSFTSKIHTPEQLIEALGLTACPWQETKGAHGYRDRKYFSCISVHYNGREDMGVWVEMSGQGCRTFESLSTKSWEDVFGWITAQQLKITRLDVAFDDHTGVLDINEIVDDTREQRYVSRSDYWETVLSSKGSTVQIGSPKSKVLVRIYDKAAERHCEPGTHWVRVELQLRDDRALQFSKIPLSVGEAFSGVLLNYLRYVIPEDTDSNKWRWQMTDYWLDTLTVTLVLGDEFSVQMNSRNFKNNIDPLFLNTLLTCRHYHISLFYTTQRFGHVDALLRQVTSCVVDCNKLWRFQRQSLYDAWEMENATNARLLTPIARRCWFVTNKDYNAYNTLACVGNLQKSFKEGDMLSEEEILSLRRNDQQANMDGVVKPSRAWRRNQKKLRK